METTPIAYKRCPNCRTNKLITEFYGVRKKDTYKCYNCNILNAKYRTQSKDKKLEEYKKEIIKEYLSGI
jgi:hypothetical protein